MNIREKQEQTELSLLSPYATRSIDEYAPAHQIEPYFLREKEEESRKKNVRYAPVSKETGIESCIVKLFVV